MSVPACVTSFTEIITIMYETAPVAGNKFEAACALRNLKRIMGQISSQSQGQHASSGHRPHVKNGKVYHRYSSPPIAMRPFANEEDDMLNKSGVIRDSKRLLAKASQKRQLETTADGDSMTHTSTGNRKVSNSSVRPVTVSDMNNWNRNLDSGAAVVKSKQQEVADNNQLIIMSKAGESGGGDKGKVAAAGQSKCRDAFAVEGYHKTDHCYFKRPDGGYLKLPPDSFHKMAEGCYIKRSDGTFVRIDSAATIGNSQTSNKSVLPNDSITSNGNRPKSTVLRFLKRSKSHTPSTMKELQREKERNEKVQNRLAVAERNALAAQQAAASGQPNPNRRVMVTMIDGGLPVLATSKADRAQKPSKAHLQVKSGKGKDGRTKVNSGFYGIQWDTLWVLIKKGYQLSGALNCCRTVDALGLESWKGKALTWR